MPLLSLAAQLPSMTTPSTVAAAASTAGLTADRSQDEPCWVPAGVLSSATCCQVFVAALEALQWTGTEPGGDLVPLLRCLRQLWHLMLSDEQLQVGVIRGAAAQSR